jgi:hypothetical protein
MRKRFQQGRTLAAAMAVPAALLVIAVSGMTFPQMAATGPHPARVSDKTSPRTSAARPGFDVGVYEPAVTSSLSSVRAFGRRTDHSPQLLLLYSEWNTLFRRNVAYAAFGDKMTIVDQMEPMGVSLSEIADGHYDSYLRSYANEVREFGHQVIIGFAHEMNGTWYSWGKGHVSPGTWVAAWRHVVTIFRQQHADNVTWLWTVAHAASGLSPYWPGSKYVSMVGIDGYFEKPSDTFNSIFGVAIKAVREITSKPILISETAAGPGTGHKAVDVTALFAGARKDDLVGLVWFNKAQNDGPHHQDWLLRGRALAAFRKAARGAA